MGRKGYKGIAPIGDNLFVINDDGQHVIKLCRIDYGIERCKIMIIAGQPGVQGNIDNANGRLALLSRPGRVQTDILNKRCYFGSRTYKNIRMISFEGAFPVTTVPIKFHPLLPTADLDFNRILITPSGEKMILADRKGPFILLVSDLLTSPKLSVLYHPASGIKTPLQGACFPIFPSHQHQFWDTDLPVSNARIRYSSTSHHDRSSEVVHHDLDRRLPICVDYCFLAAGSRIWLVPISDDRILNLPTNLLPPEPQLSSLEIRLEDILPPPPPPELTQAASTNSEAPPEVPADEGDEDAVSNIHPTCKPYFKKLCEHETPTTLVCNVSSEFPKFLIHEMIPVTSNTMLVLNRNSRRTGIWQFTTKAAWNFEKQESVKNYFQLRYLAGKEFIGPHGMTISLDRKHLVVVETGLREDDQRAGYIHVLSLHMTTEDQFRTGYQIQLIDLEAFFDGWEDEVNVASARLRREMEAGPQHRYEDIYHMDGDRFPDVTDEGLEISDITRPAVKKFNKLFKFR